MELFNCATCVVFGLALYYLWFGLLFCYFILFISRMHAPSRLSGDSLKLRPFEAVHSISVPELLEGEYYDLQGHRIL